VNAAGCREKKKVNIRSFTPALWRTWAGQGGGGLEQERHSFKRPDFRSWGPRDFSLGEPYGKS